MPEAVPTTGLDGTCRLFGAEAASEAIGASLNDRTPQALVRLVKDDLNGYSLTGHACKDHDWTKCSYFLTQAVRKVQMYSASDRYMLNKFLAGEGEIFRLGRSAPNYMKADPPEGGEETSGEKQGAKQQDKNNKKGKDNVEKDEKPEQGVKETESEQVEKKETTKKYNENDLCYHESSFET